MELPCGLGEFVLCLCVCLRLCVRACVCVLSTGLLLLMLLAVFWQCSVWWPGSGQREWEITQH